MPVTRKELAEKASGRPASFSQRFKIVAASIRVIALAAHNAVNPAGESPVMENDD